MNYEDLQDCLAGCALGTRARPVAWVVEDSAPPPKPKRRYKKVLKREAAAAAKAAIQAALSSPGTSKHLTKTEMQELTRKATEETYLKVKLKKEPRDPTLKTLRRENEEGNVEYKLRLKDPKEGNPYRIQQLITQMKYRLAEGSGECFYYIGVEDDGYPKGLDGAELQSSISTLHFMAKALGSTVVLIRTIPGASGRTCALLRVRKETAEPIAFVDLRVAVSGGVDSGKSSLVAVLTHGSNGAPDLDNGRGAARMSVLRHKHELESGRTSSISQQVLGYGEGGEVLNYSGVASLTPAEISSGAARLLTFIDMGGHERCLKTCLWGMTCLLPDYAMLCVCAVGGVGRMSKEHLAVAVALEIPLAVVLTKCDLVDETRLQAVIAQVRGLLALALPGLRPDGSVENEESIELVAPVVETSEDASVCAGVLCAMRACSSLGERRQVRIPIFATSAVNGTGLQLLHGFLRELQPSVQLKEQQQQQQQLQQQQQKQQQQDQQQQHQQAGQDQQRKGQRTPSPTLLQSPSSGPLAVSGVVGDPDSSMPPAAPHPLASADAPVMFQVDQTFDLHGVGSVVCGTVVQGFIRVGQGLVLGPDESGGFMPVVVSGMQRMHTPVALVRAGQTAALALTPQMPGLGYEAAAGAVGVALAGEGMGVDGSVATATVEAEPGTAAVPVGDDGASLQGALSEGRAGTGSGIGTATAAQQRLAGACARSPAAYVSVSVPCSPLRGGHCLLRGAGASGPHAVTAHTQSHSVHATPNRGGPGPLERMPRQPGERVVGREAAGGVGAGGPGHERKGKGVERGEQQQQQQQEALLVREARGMGLGQPQQSQPHVQQQQQQQQYVQQQQHQQQQQHHQQQQQHHQQQQQHWQMQPTYQQAHQQHDEEDLFAGLGDFDEDEAVVGVEGEEEEDVFAGMGAFDDDEPAGENMQDGYASDDLGNLGTALGLVLKQELAQSSRQRGGGASKAAAGRTKGPVAAAAGAAAAGGVSGLGLKVEEVRTAPGAQQQQRTGVVATAVAAAAAGAPGDANGFYVHRVTPASISPAQRYPSAPPAHVVLESDKHLGGDEDWQRACELATSPPAPSFLPLASSPPNSRKGAVLLDAACLGAPGSGTCWQLEAVVVLLGGRWPARGLLSGRWPPVEGAAEEDAGAPAAAAGRMGGLAPGRSSRQGPVAGGNSSDDVAADAAGGGGSAPRSREPSGGSAAPALGGGGGGGSNGRRKQQQQQRLVVGSLGASGVGGSSDNDTAPADQRPLGRSFEGPRSMGAAGGRGVLRTGSVGQRLGRHNSSGAFGEHVVVLHCGSVRQAASVVWMQELETQSRHSPSSPPLLPELDPVKYCGIRATAAILHHDHTLLSGGVGSTSAQASSSSSEELEMDSPRASGSPRGREAGDEPGGRSPRAGAAGVRGHARTDDLGCIVHVCFRFLNRPEWMRQGARIIIRDRSDGHIAGAGFLQTLDTQPIEVVTTNQFQYIGRMDGGASATAGRKQ